MYKKALALLLCTLLTLWLSLPVRAKRIYSPAPSPSLSAESAVLIEANGGNILCEKNAHSRMAMASTTKIMTALVAAENERLDKVVSVSAEAVGVEGSSIYLYAGERMTLGDLIAAMLLESANDAAAAIAIEVGGSIEGFSDMMNERARELGLKDTQFKNPHGLYDEEHYTTAYELSLIAKEMLKNEVLKKIVATKKMTVEPVEGSARLLYNHNKLLSMYEGAVGVKTGFTKKSGRCLVGAAEQDGLLLIAVTLNAPDDWNDHKSLFDFGFQSFRSVTLAKKGEVCYLQPLIGGADSSLPLVYGSDVCITVKKSSAERIERVIETYSRYEFAPVSASKESGRALWQVDGEALAEAPLVCTSAVRSASRRENIFVRIINFFKKA